MNRIMAFDVETTGLLPKSTGRVPVISEYPLILQLSFVIYDIAAGGVTTKYNNYIKVSDETEISPFITGLTGIDRATCDTKGVPICQVLRDFCDAYMSVDCVISHNIGFDRKMVEIEVHRNFSKVSGVPNMCFLFNETFNDLRGIKVFCTMAMGKRICDDMYKDSKMTRENKNGTIWKKPPKLVELHEFLFGSTPDGLHDALVDTMVCLKCFLKMQLNIDM
jgi:DNA polymerase III epsilon subunit-like protein